LDPYNQRNLLSLAEDARAAGLEVDAVQYASKVVEIAPGTLEARKARTEFGIK